MFTNTCAAIGDIDMLGGRSNDGEPGGEPIGLAEVICPSAPESYMSMGELSLGL
jgi:hypothetical protein